MSKQYSTLIADALDGKCSIDDAFKRHDIQAHMPVIRKQTLNALSDPTKTYECYETEITNRDVLFIDKRIKTEQDQRAYVENLVKCLKNMHRMNAFPLLVIVGKRSEWPLPAGFMSILAQQLSQFKQVDPHFEESPFSDNGIYIENRISSKH